MKPRLAASAGVLALAATATLFAAGTASADNGGCRAPYYADGVLTQACISSEGGRTIRASAYTADQVHNTVDLCVKIVDGAGNQYGGTACSRQDAYYGSVNGYATNVPPGRYYAVAWFTAPGYYYAGESPAIDVS
ncbi:hypothetical protein PUR71_27295 [Streptomyces sp. SP17BM10]|uniref:hypothetical protein n=1 Tax=Streptomyces sp. SP17BM10 TaxID=3002530 RepID=UPI002E78CDF5|nr:hypothetical protein [Streptomyces sp. SP17BM10]MEE1786579.1 hypothetical protein [Streptomyces sp. SP17BM10]